MSVCSDVYSDPVLTAVYNNNRDLMIYALIMAVLSLGFVWDYLPSLPMRASRYAIIITAVSNVLWTIVEILDWTYPWSCQAFGPRGLITMQILTLIFDSIANSGFVFFTIYRTVKLLTRNERIHMLSSTVLALLAGTTSIVAWTNYIKKLTSDESILVEIYDNWVIIYYVLWTTAVEMGALTIVLLKVFQAAIVRKRITSVQQQSNASLWHATLGIAIRYALIIVLQYYNLKYWFSATPTNIATACYSTLRSIMVILTLTDQVKVQTILGMNNASQASTDSNPRNPVSKACATGAGRVGSILRTDIQDSV
ncbi:uncharacterized protein SPPG_04878 [Spizellomyces punctatus DAOM BR117]|uniref:Uncharacterized protein n=1 Tax=Spizellomyces punctatus (strain DAOM BR117) TaxID=645134 RepID=A0A0L0HI87_SPIPD|nr:uncharacterized protein SPPG_04878 [Spizellomyces punctatus DAOM BR117]KND00570.1 hypothetical protein SPPG_04878 [Spizellomyces punctatus DAOM BR117]|eukprot:XP_016608609.1 hypothetical protein SPPG_04878 [Spizellomyces punctatus DAOM BR117]